MRAHDWHSDTCSRCGVRRHWALAAEPCGAQSPHSEANAANGRRGAEVRWSYRWRHRAKLRRWAREMRASGASYCEIGRLLRVSHTTARNWARSEEAP